MLTFMIVIGCLFILLFFLFITYIIVTRRKFHFHQQDSRRYMPSLVHFENSCFCVILFFRFFVIFFSFFCDFYFCFFVIFIFFLFFYYFFSIIFNFFYVQLFSSQVVSIPSCLFFTTITTKKPPQNPQDPQHQIYPPKISPLHPPHYTHPTTPTPLHPPHYTHPTTPTHIVIDYMRPASGVGASSLRYSPSNLILTDNVAFKRQATENSYNIHSPRPIPPTPPTTTSICHTLSPNSHNLPPNSLTYRFHPQLFPQAPHTPSSLQAPAFPPSSHLLPFQNSLPYQPLLHNHCNRLNSSEDFYDTIRDLQASPHDVKPPLHLSTPTTTTTTTTITSPTLSTTPFNYLLKQHHQRPESLPAVEPPPPPPHQPSPPLPSSPPPPHPDETLGVYLIPENKND